MFALDPADWAALIGAVLLLGRVGFLLAHHARLWTTDADPGRLHSVKGVYVPAVAIGLLGTVGAYRLAEELLSQLPAGKAFNAAAFVAFLAFACLGLMFDFLLDLRLSLFGGRLRGRRVPQYRMQLADADPAVRLQAARKLMTVGSRAAPAVPELLRASRDEVHEVRAVALLALSASKSNDAEIARAARSALFDPDGTVRTAAAVCLSHFGHPVEELLPTLCAGLWESGAAIALLCVDAIRGLGPEAAAAIPAIREVILTPGSPNAVNAVQALGTIGPAGVPLLIEVLETGPASCRQVAVYALQEQGDAARPALPALRRAAAGTDRRLQELAQRALRRLRA